jgi:3',5'-cyclic AMP phosphodiesterase CpdA
METVAFWGITLEQVTLAHISDTHFGRKMNNNQRLSSLPGKCYHDVLLCSGFSNAIRIARGIAGLKDEDALHFVHTGDLTNSGQENEFEVAHTFLRSRWCYQRNRTALVGIAGTPDRTASIPGNHDHMRGQWPLVAAYNPEIFGRDFRPTVWKKPPWRNSQGSFQVEVYGIDSNSGLSGTNIRARGKIADGEFEELEKQLIKSQEEADRHTIRVMLVHHSLAYTGNAFEQGVQVTLLEQNSRDRLIKIARSHSVTAILTGHTHDFFHGNLGTEAEPVWELRSAATLQGPAVLRTTSSHSPQGFWVHQIGLLNGQIHWSGWRFQWNGSGFYPMRADPCVHFPVRL